MKAVDTATDDEPQSSAAQGDYPPTFSSSLRKHCEEGCIPADVFRDLQRLHREVRSSTQQVVIADEQQRREDTTGRVSSGGGRDDGVALCRYVRLRPSAFPLIARCGATAASRLLLCYYHPPSSLSSTGVAQWAAEKLREEASGADEPSLSVVRRFTKGVLVEVLQQLSSPVEGVAVDPCGTSSSGQFERQLGDALMVSLPLGLLCWFALSHLLKLPLIFLSPVLWLEQQQQQQQVKRVDTSPWMVFAVDDAAAEVPIRWRGEAVLPDLCSSGEAEGDAEKKGGSVRLQELMSPMDAASVAAAAWLLAPSSQAAARQLPTVSLENAVGSPNVWLDLCCAPGMKLQALAEAVVHSSSSSSRDERGDVIVGVDASLCRLRVTKSLLPPSPLPLALFAADGAQFDPSDAIRSILNGVVACSGSRVSRVGVNHSTGLTAKEHYQLRRAAEEEKAGREEAHDANTSAKRRVTLPVFAPEAVREAFQSSLVNHNHHHNSLASTHSPSLLVKGVLVDVECSHDGSLAHLALQQRDPEYWKSQLPATAAPIANDYRMKRINITSTVDEDGVGLVARGPLSRWPRVVEAVQEVSGTHSHPYGDSLRWLRENPLLQLQLALLLHAFELVTAGEPAQLERQQDRAARCDGGCVSYSTCSVSYLQNEYVVRCLFLLVNQLRVLDETDSNDGMAAVLLPPLPLLEEEDEDEVVDGSATAATRSSRVISEQSGKVEQRLVALQYRLLPDVSYLPPHRLLTLRDLHRELKDQDGYGVVSSGVRCRGGDMGLEGPVGVRLWPHVTHTSFQYIARIVKRRRRSP